MQVLESRLGALASASSVASFADLYVGLYLADPRAELVLCLLGEVYGRSDLATSLSCEVGASAEARDACYEGGGELADLRIVFLSCVVEVHTSRSDSILGTL